MLLVGAVSTWLCRRYSRVWTFVLRPNRSGLCAILTALSNQCLNENSTNPIPLSLYSASFVLTVPRLLPWGTPIRNTQVWDQLDNPNQGWYSVSPQHGGDGPPSHHSPSLAAKDHNTPILHKGWTYTLLQSQDWVIHNTGTLHQFPPGRKQKDFIPIHLFANVTQVKCNPPQESIHWNPY